MRVMANLGLASATELDQTSEKIKYSGQECKNYCQIFFNFLEKFETPKSADIWLNIKFNENFFEGTIYYMEFAKDNMNIKVHKSFIQLKNRLITISESPGEKELLKYNSFPNKMFSFLSAHGMRLLRTVPSAPIPNDGETKFGQKRFRQHCETIRLHYARQIET
jgi:hypothetical protein